MVYAREFSGKTKGRNKNDSTMSDSKAYVIMGRDHISQQLRMVSLQIMVYTEQI